MITLACPHCHRLIHAANTQVGNFISCPGCQRLVPLPGQGLGGKALKRLWVLTYAGVACVFLTMVAVFGWRYFGNDIKVTTAQMKIREITQACKQYGIEHGRAPAGLEELVTKDEEGRGPYLMKETIIDPWGKPFQYDANGNSAYHRSDPLVLIPDVYCTLPDGRLIGNWDSKGK